MDSENRQFSWASIALSTLAVMSAVAGSNLKGFTWLLYLCGLILAFSFSMVCWDRFFSEKIREYRDRVFRNNILKKNVSEYMKFIERLKVLSEIERILTVEGVEWGDRRPSLYRAAQSGLSTAAHTFKDFPPEHRIVAVNAFLNELVKAFDMWLCVCDSLLQQGIATYKSERIRNDVLHYINVYHAITDLHDEWCKEINNKIGCGNTVVAFYCQTHGFNWTASLPVGDIST